MKRIADMTFSEIIAGRRYVSFLLWLAWDVCKRYFFFYGVLHALGWMT